LVELLEAKRAELGYSQRVFCREVIPWISGTGHPKSGSVFYNQILKGHRSFPPSKACQAAKLLGIPKEEARKLCEPVEMVAFEADSQITSDQLAVLTTALKASGDKMSMRKFARILELVWE